MSARWAEVLAGRLAPIKKAEPESVRLVLPLTNRIRRARGDRELTLTEAIAEHQRAIDDGSLEDRLAVLRERLEADEQRMR